MQQRFLNNLITYQRSLALDPKLNWRRQTVPRAQLHSALMDGSLSKWLPKYNANFLLSFRENTLWGRSLQCLGHYKVHAADYGPNVAGYRMYCYQFDLSRDGHETREDWD